MGYKIKNLLNPSVHNVGYLGYGKYKPKDNPKIYSIWKGILNRSYDEKYHIKYPTYKGVIVCKEWHNFQNFAEWFEKNHIEGFQLDKDILVKNNKIYSPETCCFVPKEINYLFTKTNAKRGKYPIGVCFAKKENKFRTFLNIGDSKQISLGSFITPEEAFQAYKIAKEKRIREVANKWKDKIKLEVYKAMYKYEVEITD